MHLTVICGRMSTMCLQISTELTKILLTSSPESQVECMLSIHSVVYTGIRFFTAAYERASTKWSLTDEEEI